jgi:NTP pyrophosphatase (non-canonical NTP hydrolase)
MDIQEYQKRALATTEYGSGNAIIYPALGMNGEAGEVAEKIKKVLRDKKGEFSDESKLEIAKEIGDVIWYCSALANDIGYTLDQIFSINIDKFESRRSRNVLSGNGDNR